MKKLFHKKAYFSVRDIIKWSIVDNVLNKVSFNDNLNFLNFIKNVPNNPRIIQEHINDFYSIPAIEIAKTLENHESFMDSMNDHAKKIGKLHFNSDKYDNIMNSTMFFGDKIDVDFVRKSAVFSHAYIFDDIIDCPDIDKNDKKVLTDNINIFCKTGITTNISDIQDINLRKIADSIVQDISNEFIFKQNTTFYQSLNNLNNAQNDEKKISQNICIYRLSSDLTIDMKLEMEMNWYSLIMMKAYFSKIAAMSIFGIDSAYIINESMMSNSLGLQLLDDLVDVPLDINEKNNTPFSISENFLDYPQCEFSII